MKKSEIISIQYSLKGTPFIWASALHKQLDIKIEISLWFSSIVEYGFIENQDYSAHHKIEISSDEIIYEWAIRLDMAKHIAMLQKTEKGRSIRQHLINLDEKVNTGEYLNYTQLSAIFDLCKILGYFTVQKYAEQKHYDFFNNQKEWWKYRADVLGFTKQELKDIIETIGKKYRSQRQALMQFDKYELIRVATIDLLMALGRTKEYATNVAKFTKEIAIKVKPAIYNDNGITLDFKTAEEKVIIEQIKNNSSQMLLGQF